MIKTNNLNYEKLGGLIPSIVIDINTRCVLMLGFMNEEALTKSIESKRVTFFSRSKNRLWVKGETSGNYLNLIDIKIDCDNDSLLVYAEPVGPTCHTGEYSCFGKDIKKNNDFIHELFSLLKTRKKDLPDNSYTTSLFKKGINQIAQKVGEEAVETVIAAKNNDRNELINETSDLVYHLFVLLIEQGIEFDEIVDCLKNRHINS